METIYRAYVSTLRTKGTSGKINLDLFFLIFKCNSLRGTDLQAQLTTDTFLSLIDNLPAEPLGGSNRRENRCLPTLYVFEKSRRRGRDIFPRMFVCERFLKQLRKQLRNHRVSHRCSLRVFSMLNWWSCSRSIMVGWLL